MPMTLPASMPIRGAAVVCLDLDLGLDLFILYQTSPPCYDEEILSPI